MNKLYALLVGVNEYANNIRHLSGCENDVSRMEGFFERHVKGSFDFHAKKLISRSATKDGIVQTFREHLLRDNLQAGDALLFYFSGHGAQEAAHKAFWLGEPNRKIQVLACHDSEVQTGKNFLADKELRYLIHQAASRREGVEVVTIFDCCHSGDNTRSITPGGVVERLCDSVRERDWSDFIFGTEILPETILQSTLDEVLPQGKHVQLAACDSHESAYERSDDGGFFTSALLEVLERSEGDLNYLDLKNRVKSTIRGKSLNKDARPQTPQVYAYDGTSPESRQLCKALFKTFLGGVIREKPIASEVYFNRQLHRWELDQGAVYGVATVWEGEPQQLTVATSDSGFSIATVAQVFPGYSVIEFDPYADINKRERYAALVPSLMSRMLPFSLQGDESGVQVFQEANPPDTLLKANLKCVAARPEFIVRARDGNLLITQPGDDRPLTEPVPYQEAERAREQLKKIGRWAFVKNLKNEASEIPDKAFDFEITQNGQPVPIENGCYMLQLPTANTKGRPAGKLEIKLTNGAYEPLYYGIVYLSTLFGVRSTMFWEKPYTVRRLDPGRSHQKTLSVSLEQFISDFHWPHEDFHFLCVAAASEFSLELMEQEDLEAPRSLDRSANKMGAFGDETPGGTLDLADWRTRLLTFRMLNPASIS